MVTTHCRTQNIEPQVDVPVIGVASPSIGTATDISVLRYVEEDSIAVFIKEALLPIDAV